MEIDELEHSNPDEDMDITESEPQIKQGSSKKLVSDSPTTSEISLNPNGTSNQNTPQSEFDKLLKECIELELLPFQIKSARKSYYDLPSQNGLVGCPFSWCSSAFKNSNGLQYHLQKAGHQITDFEKSTREKTDEMNIKYKELLSMISGGGPQISPSPVEVMIQSHQLLKPRKKTLIFVNKHVKIPKAVRGNKKDPYVENFFNHVYKDVERHDCMIDAGVYSEFNDWSYDTVLQSIQSEYYLESLELKVVRKENESDSKFADTIKHLEPLEIGSSPRRAGWIINVGIAVWSMAWAPIKEKNQSQYQYLAVAGYLDKNAHMQQSSCQTLDAHDMKGCIQIWKFKSTDLKSIPFLYLTIFHGYGHILDMCWCPNYSFDPTKGRIGFIGVTSGDGAFRILDIPYYNDDQSHYLKSTGVVFQSKIPDCQYHKLSWNLKNQVALGSTNGYITVWDVRKYLAEKTNDNSDNYASPLIHIAVHDSSIRCIDWLPPDEERNIYQIVSGGVDGRLLCLDIRDPSMPVPLARIRGFVTSLAVCPAFKYIANVDADYAVKTLTPTEKDKNKKSMTEYPQYLNRTVIEHYSAVWSLDYSPIAPLLASASADGVSMVVNLNQVAIKRRTVAQPIFKLDYNTLTEELTFIDSNTERSLGTSFQAAQLYHPYMAIHCVRWNPNGETGEYLATGGIGWIRVEVMDVPF
ncbi:WD40-repeat-containing domain protein [Globomyces pollinis-pini]|nr:WD40-repeat-containing domain protein [Globomyces pollinis-pini]